MEEKSSFFSSFIEQYCIALVITIFFWSGTFNIVIPGFDWAWIEVSGFFIWTIYMLWRLLSDNANRLAHLSGIASGIIVLLALKYIMNY
jgi:hypothetical protein